MRTYIPDQWIRNWFLGGTDTVDYSNNNQLSHSNQQTYIHDLKKVWINSSKVCENGAKMVIRFGGLSVEEIDPKQIIKNSLIDTGWKLKTVRNAGNANKGHRQADSFMKKKSNPMNEYDLWLELE